MDRSHLYIPLADWKTTDVHSSAPWTIWYVLSAISAVKRNIELAIGPVVRTSPDKLDICDISAVKEIHKTNSRFSKTEFYRNLVAGNAHNLFSTSDRGFHAAHRRLLASPISDSSLTHLEPLIVDKIHLATSKITQELEARGVVDIFKWWLFMTTDIIGDLTFGDSFRMLETGKVSKEKSFCELCGKKGLCMLIAIVENPIQPWYGKAVEVSSHSNNISNCIEDSELCSTTSLQSCSWRR